MNEQVEQVLQAIYEDGTGWSDIKRSSYLPEVPKISTELQQVDNQIWGVLFALDPTNRDTFAHPIHVWENLKQGAWAAGYQQAGHFSQAKGFDNSIWPQYMTEVERIKSFL